MRRVLVVAMLAVVLSGCASIVSDSDWPVTLTSSPDGATVEVEDENGVVVHRAPTPCTVVLASGDGWFDGMDYTVRCSADGYAPGESPLTSRLNGWYFGNVLFGGTLGLLLVDPLTGAMWRMPDAHHSVLSPAGTQ